MTFEEILQKKQIGESVVFSESIKDDKEYVVNEKCFNCETTMSFVYHQIPIRGNSGYIICRPLRLYEGKCVKCKESHYALLYGEPESTSLFFFPDASSMVSEYSSYEQLLSSQQLSDLHNSEKAFSMGLYAASLLYIRRVLESLVFQILKENNEDFKKTEKFVELLKKAEKFIKIFPDDFSDIKGTFYKFISEGVHEWTDQECSEQYPLAKYAIVRILDHYKQGKDREKKNSELRKAIGKMNNDKRP